MEATTTIHGDFASEALILTKIAHRLGQARHAGKRQEFEETLRALDMPEEEVRLYWDLITGAPHANGTVDLTGIRSNTQLAHYLGIFLENTMCPRNALVYRLAQCHFPDILQVHIQNGQHLGGQRGKGNPPGKRLVRFTKWPERPQAIYGGPMAVFELYQGKQPAQFRAAIRRAADPFCQMFGAELGMSFADLLVGCKMLIPPLPVARLLADVIRAGLSGQEVTVVGAFCPDYGYEETGDPQIPYRYTFDTVGEGVGLVAQQFVRIVPVISGFLTRLGIKHRIVLSIGDFEADSQTVLDRVGVTRHEFRQRCQKSLFAFRQMVPAALPLTLELFGEERSRERLRPYAQEATDEMLAGRFGTMGRLYPDLPQVIARIPKQYGSFYRRWFGPNLKDEEVTRTVFVQGGEYAAVARIYAEDFGRHVIMLAGDRPEMHLFNTFFQSLPTLCAKRAY